MVKATAAPPKVTAPCPLCGGTTCRAEGTISELVMFNADVYRKGRPAVWTQCNDCEWCEE